MILLDTSGLLSALFPDQPKHADSLRVLENESGPFLLSPFILAEVDYLLGKLGGVAVELGFLREVARGAHELVRMDKKDIDEAVEVVATYRDLGIGLADASIVVLSRRYRCLNVLTLDERHFRVVRGHGEKPFWVLPSDDE